MAITLPEITIEGAPSTDPIIYWFNEGYSFGWNHPDQPGQPPQVSVEFEQAYNVGLEAGSSNANGAMATYAGPTAGPDIGGQPLDQYEASYREALEAIFHQHMPHNEVEGEVVDPPEVTISFVVP